MEEQTVLERLVWNEPQLCQLLNLEKHQLDELRREKSLPYIKLSSRSRVFLADDVLGWLKKHRINT